MFWRIWNEIRSSQIRWALEIFLVIESEINIQTAFKEIQSKSDSLGDLSQAN